MALAAPTDLTLVNLMRGIGLNASTFNVYQQRITAPGPPSITLMGVLRWSNIETAAHTVEVTVNGKSVYAARGATSMLVELGTRVAPDVSNLAVSASVRLVNTSESSSAATLTTTLNIQQATTFPAGVMSVAAKAINFPDWTGWINVGFTKVPADPSVFIFGVVEYFQDALPVAYRTILVRRNETFTSAVGYPLAITDVRGGSLEFQFYNELNSAVGTLALPSVLQSGAIHRTTLTVYAGTLNTGVTKFLVREARSVLTGGQTLGASFVVKSIPAVFGDLHHYTFGTLGVTNSETGKQIATLFFEAPVPDGPFEVEDVVARVVKNAVGRFELRSTYRATWAVLPGETSNFVIEYEPVVFGTAGPDRAYLVGSIATAGSYVIPLVATKVGSAPQLDVSAKATISVLDNIPRTTIATNSSISRDGIDARVGEAVNISLASTPTPATWRAEGLPTGVTVDENGRLAGVPTRAGVFFASITAQAPDFDVSLPLTIKFAVGVGTTPLTSDASQRVPWLLSEWNLTDLQVVARSREVQSTFLEGAGGLRIKLGDDVCFVVFFVGVNNEVFAMAPETLRLTIRTANNLDDVLVFKAAAPPVAVVREGMTYYEMNVRTGNRERELALEWVEEAKADEPLPCVADLDWTKDGKVYSSRTFPMLLELDVTRP